MRQTGIILTEPANAGRLGPGKPLADLFHNS
jgi:hypothetical protein